jgi:hypothetical protein
MKADMVFAHGSSNADEQNAGTIPDQFLALML